MVSSPILKLVKGIATMSLPRVVFVLGAPGAGKGTQCEKIVKKYDYVHLSAGDLLREERQNPASKFGELIDNYITEGKIVPVEITCSLLEQAMNKSANNKFLIDGFPRNQNNLEGWQKQVANKVVLQFVLFFDCPKKDCVQRCLGRGAAGSGRSDDNMESLEKRFNTYINETQPIIKYYEEKNLVRKIDATKSPEEVFEDVKTVFRTLEGSGDM